MSFEKNLLNGIPLDEAASFFLRIRGKDKVASAKDFDAALAALPEAERTALLKSAAAMPFPTPGKVKKSNAMPMAGGAAGAMPMTSPAAMPPTARGQNMRPTPTPALPPTAMGQNTSPGMKMASDKSPEETGKERARASLTAEFEKEKGHAQERKGDIVGRGIGGALGGAAMHRYGKGNPLATLGGIALGEHLGGKLGRETGAMHDSRRHEKAASAFKLALEQAGMSPPPGIVPQLDPETAQALALQQQGDQAAEQGEAAFLRQKMEELRAQAAEAQETATTLQSQQEMVEQQQAQYQAQVADATQKAMESQDQVLQQQQAAAAMRMAYQELRGQMLEAASAEPPTLTPSIGSQAAAAAASQAAGASSAPSPTAGPAGGAPNPGVPPAGMAPLGDDTVSTPAEKNEPTFEGASSTTSVGQKEPSGDAKTPGKEVLSHYRPLAGGGKTASLRELMSEVGSQAKGVVRAHLPHAAAGALVGAGLGAGEAFSSNEPLRKGVAELEANPDRGYKDTLNLAQKKARLTIGEFAQKHPAAMIGIGALGGAGIGASQGPGAMAALREGAGHVKGIGKDLKTLYQGAA